MTLHLYRSNRTELLVDALHGVLEKKWPADPFLPVPVVVGSRGMERWLRHELATRAGIAARIVFPFPRQAIDGAAQWLLEGAQPAQHAFWEGPAPSPPEPPQPAPDHAAAGNDIPARVADPQQNEDFSSAGLAMRVVPLLRRHAGDLDFAAPSRYLQLAAGDAPNGDAVSAREISFALELGEVLDRMLQDRPREALSWARQPDTAPDAHRWLARLLQDLNAAGDDCSPALSHERLRSEPLPQTKRPLFLFGLSSVGPGDRERLEALATALELHLFLLAPSDRWWQDLRSRPQALAALRRARSESERRTIEDELASQNTVLASLGLPSRDMQAWLEQFDYDEDQVTSPAADGGDAPPTLLHGLQGWVLRAEGPGDAAGTLRPDNSLSLHATHGPLRQCEVLREELLRLFAADETLEPRDVLVMTPDLETYAPLLAGVFARRPRMDVDQAGGAAAATPAGPKGAEEREADPTRKGRRGKPRLPAIPTAIADLGLRQTNPVAEVTLRLLELAGERHNATRLLELLALDPVQRRLGLPDEDLGEFRDLLADAGFRWAEDAKARSRDDVQQPELDQNTLRFALERMALGHLMPDEEPFGVVQAPGADLPAAAPFDLPTREGLERFAILAAAGRQVALQRERLRGPHTLATWRERLRDALDALTETGAKRSWLRAEVNDRLEALDPQDSQMGHLLVDRAALIRWLSGSFELAQRGDRPVTGAVTVCALQPMRAVPFRVVAIVGLDDGAFPRSFRPRTWDPFVERRYAERDPREIDRHLLLEAMLSARQHLLLLWTGFEAKRGDTQPAAVPVEELLEVLQGLTGVARKDLVRAHSLQPWSPTNFAAAGPYSHDARMARAAQRLRALRTGAASAKFRGLAASGTAPLPSEEQLVARLSLDDLARDLVRPQRLLLQRRLRLYLPQEQRPLADREPLKLDTLETWGLHDRVLTLLQRQPQLAQDRATLLELVHTRMAAEGALPLEAGGRRLLQAEIDAALELLEALEACAGELQTLPALSVPLSDGLLLVGCAPRARRRNDGVLLLEFPWASKEANAITRMRAWLHLLAAQAARHPVGAARTVARANSASEGAAAGTFLEPLADREAALVLLGQLVGVWRQARRQPLELFERTSPLLAAACLRVTPAAAVPGHEPVSLSDRLAQEPELRAALAKQAEQGWFKNDWARTDQDDEWVQALFTDYDPREHLRSVEDHGLLGLMQTVWLPLVGAEAAGRELPREWAPGGAGDGGDA